MAFLPKPIAAVSRGPAVPQNAVAVKPVALPKPVAPKAVAAPQPAVASTHIVDPTQKRMVLAKLMALGAPKGVR